MSEYWVSQKKYYCKYCEIYIADDVPSRRQHESGLRHKGNRERFVRGLYKQGERRNKDLAEEKREMARVEVAANAAFARDVSSGHASLPSSSSSSKEPEASRPAAASKKPERPTSVWSNYTTAQSLGITDPDEERMKAETERRKTQGVVGDWEVVAPPPPPLPSDLQASKEDSKEEALNDSLPQKRQAEAPLQEEEDGRQFKFRKRTMAAGLGEIWDPGNIPIKLKSKPNGGGDSASPADQIKPKDEPDTTPVGSSQTTHRSQGSTGEGSKAQALPGPVSQISTEGKLKWQPMQWKRATEPVSVAQTDLNEETVEHDKCNHADLSIQEERPCSSNSQQLDNGDFLKIEHSNDEATLVKPNVKVEDSLAPASAEPSGGLFRKRKVPGAARGRRE